MANDNDDHIKNGQISEDQIMVYTHGIRKNIVTKMMENGNVPGDTKDIQTLAGVLNDMDRTAISVKRIKSDEQGTNAMVFGGAALVAKLLMGLNTKNVAVDNTNIPNYKPPVLGNDLPQQPIIPGEMDVGTSTINYEEFAKIHFPNNEG